MTPNLELAKIRDFGEIVGDSFLFLRQNFKPLLRTFFTFCGFFVLASIVTAIVQQLNMREIVGNIEPGSYNSTLSNIRQLSTFGITAILNIIFLLLTYTSIPVTILSYIVLYKEKGNTAPTNEEMWGYFKYYYLKILGAVILNGIILVIGLVFCILPFFWLYPIVGLILPIIVMENASYGYSFNQAFRLVKDNWWTTFGAMFVMGIIVGVAGAIVTVPASLWNQISLISHWPGGKIAAVLTAILSHVALVLYILPVITLALCYFSLNEGKEATGLMARIDRIGETDSKPNLPTEEY